MLNSEGVMDNATLTMPFYGKANVIIYRPWAGSCQWPAGFVCFTFTAGGQTASDGCCDIASCQPGNSCFSSLSWSKTFSNIPMGSSISLTANGCTGGSWTDIPITYQSTSNLNEFDLIGNGCAFGKLKFTQTTPTLCDNGPSCYESFEVPQVRPKVVDYDNDYPYDPCSNQNLYAGTVPVIGWDKRNNRDTKEVFLEDFNIEACFNLETQKWRFKVSNDYRLEPRIVQAVCDDNITSDQVKLADSLDDVDPNYPCKDIVSDIVHYYEYGWSRANHYLFRKLILAHENLHVWSYQDQINTGYDKYLQEYRNALDNLECERFNDQEDAENFAKETIKNLTYDLCYNAAVRDKVFNAPNPLARTRSEEALHKFIYPIIFEWWLKAIDNCQ